jgi:hypothetical protein
MRGKTNSGQRRSATLRLLAVSAAAVTVVALCGFHAPKTLAAVPSPGDVAKATELPVAALMSRTEQAKPKSLEMCMYYKKALCLDSGTVNTIAVVVVGAAQIIVTIILGRRGGSGGKHEKKIQIEDEQKHTKDYGDCLRVVGSWVRWDKCARKGKVGQACTWFEVPTGRSFALESEYIYLHAKGLKEYMMVEELKSGQEIFTDQTGTFPDHDRIWYFPAS